MLTMDVLVLFCLLFTSTHVQMAALQNPIVVTTIESDHFCVRNPNNRSRFTGFIPDLLNAVMMRINRSYTLKHVQDSRYGAFDGVSWTGMIGEVIDGSVDMAAAPITVTPERSKAVDFSIPYLTVELAILMYDFKQEIYSTNLWGADIFDSWLCLSWLLVAITSVSILLVNARFNPVEDWSELHVGDHFLVIFHGGRLPGKSWFPKSNFGKIFLSVWSIFCVLTVGIIAIQLNSYGFKDRQDPVLEDYNSFVRSIDTQGITPIFLNAGATLQYFKSSSLKEDQVVYYRFLKSGMKGFNTYNHGIQRLRELKKFGLAFIVESPLLDYVTQRRPCDLTGVRLGIKNVYYSFVFRTNSTLRKEVDAALASLRSDETIDYLYKKWFFKNECSKTPRTKTFWATLNFNNITLLLIFYAVGLGIAVLSGIVEFMWCCRRQHRGRPSSDSAREIIKHTDEAL